jgi:hypothetical protein
LPPGFSAEQAKKPILKEDASRLAADNGSTQVAPKPEMPLASENSVDAQKRAELEAAKKTLADDEKKVTEAKKEQKKLTIGQKIKKEVQHYWDGTKLLATEVRISSRLALKMAAGYELSRREHRQVGVLLPLRSSVSGFNLRIEHLASTDGERSWPIDPILDVHHYPLRRTAASHCFEAVPQPAA